MALTQRECDEVFSEVVEMMRDHGLAWIVDEVQGALALGKIRTIKVNRRKKVLGEDEMSMPKIMLTQPMFPGSARNAPAQAVSDESGTDELTSENYSSKEALKLLLESLGRYVEDLHDLATHLPMMAVRTTSPLDAHSFFIVADNNAVPFEVSTNMQLPRRDFASQLKSIIDKI